MVAVASVVGVGVGVGGARGMCVGGVRGRALRAALHRREREHAAVVVECEHGRRGLVVGAVLRQQDAGHCGRTRRLREHAIARHQLSHQHTLGRVAARAAEARLERDIGRRAGVAQPARVRRVAAEARVRLVACRHTAG